MPRILHRARRSDCAPDVPADVADTGLRGGLERWQAPAGAPARWRPRPPGAPVL